jgi:hypothetical protein
MPISGIFWTSEELQKLLSVSKQRISNLAQTYKWESPAPGLYRGGVAEDSATVDAYLFARNRAMIRGESRPNWDDSFDLDCPECGAFALEWPDHGHYKCILGHTGELARSTTQG